MTNAPSPLTWCSWGDKKDDRVRGSACPHTHTPNPPLHKQSDTTNHPDNHHSVQWNRGVDLVVVHCFVVVVADMVLTRGLLEVAWLGGRPNEGKGQK